MFTGSWTGKSTEKLNLKKLPYPGINQWQATNQNGCTEDHIQLIVDVHSKKPGLGPFGALLDNHRTLCGNELYS